MSLADRARVVTLLAVVSQFLLQNLFYRISGFYRGYELALLALPGMLGGCLVIWGGTLFSLTFQPRDWLVLPFLGICAVSCVDGPCGFILPPLSLLVLGAGFVLGRFTGYCLAPGGGDAAGKRLFHFLTGLVFPRGAILTCRPTIITDPAGPGSGTIPTPMVR